MQAVSARRMRGPSDTNGYKGMRPHGVKFRRREAALGADQQRGGSVSRDDSRCDGAFGRRVELPPRLPIPEDFHQGARRMQPGHCQPLALFRRLDGDGGKPGLVHPVRIGPLCDNRKECRHSQFGGLLHDKVGGVALQQCENQPKVRLGRLRAQAVLDQKGCPVAPDGLDLSYEFSVAPVEQPHRVTSAATHDGTEIVRLRRGRLDRRTGSKRLVHIQAD